MFHSSEMFYSALSELLYVQLAMGNGYSVCILWSMLMQVINFLH